MNLPDNLVVTPLHGSAIRPYISELSKLRIQLFREFPYLYEGDLEYEENYLKPFVNCPYSTLVLVKDGDQIVGASSALPLSYEVEEIKQPFRAPHIPIEQVYYFGESLLLPEYRGQGIGRHFFAARELAARELGYKMSAFFAVERPDNHPSKPISWHPLDEFWQSLGYVKRTDMHAQFSWKDVDEDDESLKPMVFWLKEL